MACFSIHSKKTPIKKIFCISAVITVIFFHFSGTVFSASSSDLSNLQNLQVSVPAKNPSAASSPQMTAAVPSGTLFSAQSLSPLSSAQSAEQGDKVTKQITFNEDGGALANAPGVRGSNGAVVAQNGAVAFASSSALTPADTNQKTDIYMKGPDGQLIWITKNGNGDSFDPKITADGRYVIFTSYATNLVPDNNGTSNKADIFRYDLGTGIIDLISRTWNPNTRQWTQAKEGDSSTPNLSSDGHYAAYLSYASNLPGAKAQERGAYVLDLRLSTTKRVNNRCHGESFGVAVSEDGSYAVSDCATGSNLTNRSIILHNMLTGEEKVIDIVSGSSTGLTHSGAPQIANGIIVFESNKHLVPEDTDSSIDVYTYEIATGKLSLLSPVPHFNTAEKDSLDPGISSDGRFIVFESQTQLLSEDRNGMMDIYLYDRTSKTLRLVTDGTIHVEGRYSGTPSVQYQGDQIFVSYHSNVTSSTANTVQVFVAKLPLNPKPPPPPAVPSNFRAFSVSLDQIVLTWDYPAGQNITGFEITRSINGGPAVRVSILTAGAKSITYTGLSSNTTYVYQIRALGENQNSVYSQALSVTTKQLTPVALTAKGGTRQITLSWNYPAGEPITGFEIVRSLNGGNDMKIATLSPQARSFVDINLPDGATGYYLIRAVKGSAYSLYSNTAIAVTTKPLPPPTGFSAVSLAANVTVLNWNYPADQNITGFEIFRSTNGGIPVKIATLPPASRSFIDLYYLLGGQYQYQIRAVQGPQTSSYSTTILTKILK